MLMVYLVGAETSDSIPITPPQRSPLSVRTCALKDNFIDVLGLSLSRNLHTDSYSYRKQRDKE